MKLKPIRILMLLAILLSLFALFKVGVKTFTGKFILTDFILAISLSLFTFLLIFLVLTPSLKYEQKEFLRLMKNLFDYADKIVVGRKEEFRKSFEDTVKDFVRFSRDIVNRYEIKVRVLNEKNAEEILSGLIFKMYDIKHRKDHLGAKYVHAMRKNPYDLRVTKAALKFLSSMEPKVYGMLAEDLYNILHRISR